MEVLQILKFMYRKDRLSFTEGLVATEAECSVPDVDSNTIDYLLSHGNISELLSLFSDASL